MIDPISANLIASSFSGLAGFTMRSERDSSRVQGLDKSGSTADRNSRFSDNMRSAGAKSSEASKAQKNTDATGLNLSEEEKEAIRKLQARDQEVRAHEQAHMSAAGGLARGGANYTYTQGPDGKQYAIGGSVSIDTSVDSEDPEKMKQKARQIQAAALAPADPSSQDMAVAASASKMMSDAEAKKAEENRNPEKSENKDGSSALENTESSEDIENSEKSENINNANSLNSANQSITVTRTGYAPQKLIRGQAQASEQITGQISAQAPNTQVNGVRQYGTSANSEGAVSGYAIFSGALKFSGESSILPVVSSLAKPNMSSAMKTYAQVSGYAAITAQDNQNSSSPSPTNSGANASLSKVA